MSNKMNPEEALKICARTIVDGHKNGRIPAFLFGASGTPIWVQEYFHAKRAIEESGNYNYEGTPFSEIAESPNYPERPAQARFFGDLKTMHNGEVWSSFCRSFLTDWVIKYLYRFRTDKGIDEEVVLRYGILDHLVKKAKGKHAQELLILTTNFDGAIPAYLKSQNSDQMCFVLENVDRIKAIGKMKPMKPLGVTVSSEKVMPIHIITLRGDVYHAHCTNTFCSMHNKMVTVYEALEHEMDKNNSREELKKQDFGDAGKLADIYFLKGGDVWRADCVHSKPNNLGERVEIAQSYKLDEELSGAAKRIVDGIMRCPECAGDRILSISFPGLDVKEREISALMSAVWASFGSKVSTICTVGFSGNSDREIVKYLVKTAEINKAPWFDFGVSDNKGISLNKFLRGRSAVREAGIQSLGWDPANTEPGQSPRFATIDWIGSETQKKGAEGALPELLKLIKESEKSTDIHADVSENEIAKKEEDVEIPVDLLWLEDSGGDQNFRAIQQFDGRDHPLTCCIRKDFPAKVARVVQHVMSANAQMIDLQNTSQLALKDYWWNPGMTKPRDAKKHSRMQHSLGVLRIAEAWLGVLIQKAADWDGGRPKESKDLNEAQKMLLQHRKSLHLAAFLHDIGHIPFSHLIEEVFNELHWQFDDRKYSHEQLTEIRINALARSGEIEPAHKTFILDLISGATGNHFLDAIINGPFDADKIDYLFRDQRWIGLAKKEEDCFTWFGDFISDQEVTAHGQILLHGKSAAVAYRLLRERAYLYDTLYFSPKVRVMERILSHILTSYFVMKISNEEVVRILKLMHTQKANKPSIEIEDLVAEYFTSVERESGEEDEKGSATVFWQNVKEWLDDNNENLSDLGCAKLILSIADIYRMIDKDYPLTRDFLNGKKKQGKTKSTHHPLLEFLSGNWHSVRDAVAEVRMIAEIGVWAENHKPKTTQYSHLADACHLLLDPYDAGKISHEESRVDKGKWLDRLFKNHCIAGPYILRAPSHQKNVHKAEQWLKSKQSILLEIGRQLSHEYPGRILLDITGPLKVRSYPDRRILHDSDKMPLVCEQFWVPAGDPQSWSVRSKAEIPLSSVDFRSSLQSAYKMRILLINPTKECAGNGIIIDRFRRACKIHDIPLEEESNDHKEE